MLRNHFFLFVLIFANPFVHAIASTTPEPELVAQVGHGGAIHRLLFCQADQLLVSAAYDGTVRIWDARKGKLLRVIYAHAHTVTTMAGSPDERLIATGGDDGQLKVWNIDTGELRFNEALSKPISAVTWSSGGTQLAASTLDKTVIFDRSGTAMFKEARWLPASSQISYLAGSSHMLALASWESQRDAFFGMGVLSR
jgi:WD40 repeat protein